MTVNRRTFATLCAATLAAPMFGCVRVQARKTRSGARNQPNGRGAAARSRLPRQPKKGRRTAKKGASARERQLKKVFVEAVSDARARWVWLE
jgi:hypothetical protein